MRYLFLLLFLVGCSATQPPSEIITETAQTEIKNIHDTIKLIDEQTKPECKTEALISNLKAIENQIKSVGGQIDAINSSCVVEKQELETKITNREIVIVSLIVFILVCLFFKLKGKLL